MEVELRYEEFGALDIPDENLLGVYTAGDINPEKIEKEIIKESLSNPIGSSSVETLAREARDVLIICDDNTRTTPADRILPFLLEEIHKAGIQDKNIKILMALGTHRKMTKEELVAKLGREVVDKYTVVNHDYKDTANLKPVGETSLGIEVWVNKLVCEADLVIGIGCIFPHMNVGFSGGGKIIVPGVSGEETSARTHWMMTSYRAEELFGVCDNPIRDAIEDIAEKAGLQFIINVVQSKEGRIYGMVAGRSRLAHRQGAKIARKVYGAKIPRKADVVVCEAYPGDVDLWQTSKCIGVAGLAMKENGIAIIVSPCPDGISHSFPELSGYGYPPAKEVIKMCKRGEIGELLAVHMFQVSRVITDQGKGILVSDGLTREQTEKMGFLCANDLNEALEKAVGLKGKKSDILVLRHAAELLPILEN